MVKGVMKYIQGGLSSPPHMRKQFALMATENLRARFRIPLNRVKISPCREFFSALEQSRHDEALLLQKDVKCGRISRYSARCDFSELSVQSVDLEGKETA